METKIKIKRTKLTDHQRYSWRCNVLDKFDFDLIKQMHDEIYEAEEQYDTDYSVDGIIAREIGKTRIESFKRYGDRNHITKSLILQYISDKGVDLDVQAYWLTENYEKDIDPGDIANFMMQYDRGPGQYEAAARIEELKDAWKTQFGINFDKKLMRYYFNKKQKPVETQKREEDEF